jgi:shikimate 5-dehydrogenase
MRVDERLAGHITNTLAPVTEALVTGIVGEAPSKYAKTPPLWNAVYRELGWNAVSVPWDVTPAGLSGFVKAARETDAIAGFNVTNPFKIAIVPLVDDLDPLARQIGAVNTVVRQDDGRLVGYNTDGQGAIDALTARLPGEAAPFVPTLDGARVVVIGAGGASRAVSFYLARAIGSRGALRIVSRGGDGARGLAAVTRQSYGVGDAADERRLLEWVADADLVVNATVKGQSGWRRLPDGSACQLEPYSALGPADPAAISAGRPLDQSAARDWFAASREDLLDNARVAGEVLARLAPGAACFDLIYSPLETRFLAAARLAGHPTQNGKWMNVAQAADAFARKICLAALASRGLGPADGHARVFEIMARAW